MCLTYPSFFELGRAKPRTDDLREIVLREQRRAVDGLAHVHDALRGRLGALGLRESHLLFATRPGGKKDKRETPAAAAEREGGGGGATHDIIWYGQHRRATGEPKPIAVLCSRPPDDGNSLAMGEGRIRVRGFAELLYCSPNGNGNGNGNGKGRRQETLPARLLCGHNLDMTKPTKT